MTIIIALLFAFAVYLSVGFFFGRNTKKISDMLPMGLSNQARVDNPREFSSSTVATTISLATVIMAFFELAQRLGVWLFWTVITTSAGLLLVRLFAGKIWEKINNYDHRPTLHEFLGTEFNSRTLQYVGAACTSLGFLLAFAVELTVGSKFFAGLVPGIPTPLVIIALSAVAFTYTASGGFRAVIVTDRLQMISIWLLLLALPAFYIYYVVSHGGWSENIIKIPSGLLNFSYKDGLPAFLLGIFVINVPTFISDMSIWQRIAGSQKGRTVTGGLWNSVFSSAATWGLFALLACFAFMIITPDQDVNPLVAVLQVVRGSGGAVSTMVLFFAILGLYGAMLSTASTQLIAVSHTLYEDIFSHITKLSLKERVESKKQLLISRLILVLAAAASTLIVQLLSYAGFSIADMVFAIYGAQLGLCPLVIAALTLKRDTLKRMSVWAVTAVSMGFVTGWSSAVYGRFTGNTSLVFLSPVLSLLVSSILFEVGFLASKTKRSS
ncbi:MAG: hypothetical protein JW912_04095 [Sedimentisphaerales bacterium]|nr:hypothetical protein [Sedimentisphaerales bacterium]